MPKGQWVGIELDNGRKININTRTGIVETKSERDKNWRTLNALVAVSDESEFVFDDNHELKLNKCINKS